jgi:hypothetical protein
MAPPVACEKKAPMRYWCSLLQMSDGVRSKIAHILLIRRQDRRRELGGKFLLVSQFDQIPRLGRAYPIA